MRKLFAITLAVLMASGMAVAYGEQPDDVGTDAADGEQPDDVGMTGSFADSASALPDFASSTAVSVTSNISDAFEDGISGVGEDVISLFSTEDSEE